MPEPPSSTPHPPDQPPLEGIRQLEQLVGRGHEILAACDWDGLRYRAFRPIGAPILRFREEAVEAIEACLGEGAPESRRLATLLADPGGRAAGYHIREIVEVLETALGRLRTRLLLDAPDAALLELRHETIEVAELLLHAGDLDPALEWARCTLVTRLAARARAAGIDPCGCRHAIDLADRLRIRGVIGPETHRVVERVLRTARPDPAGRPADPDRIEEAVRLAAAFCRDREPDARS